MSPPNVSGTRPAASRSFSSSSRFSTVIELLQERLQPNGNGIERLYKEGEAAQLGGVHRSTLKRWQNGTPPIFDALIQKIEKISASISEMDFLDSGKTTKAGILQGFGINPIILGEIITS